MAKRRSFIPEAPAAASLEGRVVLSTTSTVGHWFNSQYNHVRQDLGIAHKHPATASAGIQDMWNHSASLSKPTHHAHPHHVHPHHLAAPATAPAPDMVPVPATPPPHVMPPTHVTIPTK